MSSGQARRLLALSAIYDGEPRRAAEIGECGTADGSRPGPSVQRQWVLTA